MPRVNETHRVFLTIKRSNGVPAPGVDPGDVTITIRNPADDASSVVALVESALGGGLYFFDVPASFTSTHGTGIYGLLIDIDSTSPKVRDTAGGSIPFFSTDIDAIQTTAALAEVNIDEVHRRLGLKSGTPCVHNPASIVTGAISQTITVAGPTVTVSRDP